MTIRGRLIGGMSPAAFEYWVQQQGWPSALAYAQALTVGNRLRHGERVTNAEAATLAAHWGVGPEQAAETLTAIMREPDGLSRATALARALGFQAQPEHVRAQLETYESEGFVAELNARRAERLHESPSDARDREAERAKRPPSPEEIRRADLLAAFDRVHPRAAPPRNVREGAHMLADKFDVNIALARALQVPSGRAPDDARDRRNDIAVAAEFHELKSAADEILDVDPALGDIAEADQAAQERLQGED